MEGKGIGGRKEEKGVDRLLLDFPQTLHLTFSSRDSWSRSPQSLQNCIRMAMTVVIRGRRINYAQKMTSGLVLF